MFSEETEVNFPNDRQASYIVATFYPHDAHATLSSSYGSNGACLL